MFAPPLGWIAAIKGLDNFVAGTRQVWNNKETPTLTEHFFGKGVDIGTDILSGVLGVGGTISASLKLTNTGAAAIQVLVKNSLKVVAKSQAVGAAVSAFAKAMDGTAAGGGNSGEPTKPKLPEETTDQQVKDAIGIPEEAPSAPGAAQQVAGHHPWSKYLQGPAKQALEKLPANLHNEYHGGLDKLLPRQYGSKYYQQLSPAQQAANFEKLRKYTQAFDQQHGTNLWEAIKRTAAALPGEP
jgi:hypothetical protein